MPLFFSVRTRTIILLCSPAGKAWSVVNYSAQIYAYEEENIAVTGSGTLDGNANNTAWWNWNGKKSYGWKEGMPKANKSARLAACADAPEC